MKYYLSMTTDGGVVSKIYEGKLGPTARELYENLADALMLSRARCYLILRNEEKILRRSFHDGTGSKAAFEYEYE